MKYNNILDVKIITCVYTYLLFDYNYIICVYEWIRASFTKTTDLTVYYRLEISDERSARRRWTASLLSMRNYNIDYKHKMWFILLSDRRKITRRSSKIIIYYVIPYTCIIYYYIPRYSKIFQIRLCIYIYTTT